MLPLFCNWVFYWITFTVVLNLTSILFPVYWEGVIGHLRIETILYSKDPCDARVFLIFHMVNISQVLKTKYKTLPAIYLFTKSNLYFSHFLCSNIFLR